MPGWSEILGELSQPGVAPDLDGVRRRYLAAYAQLVQRDVIVYFSGWLQNPGGDAFASSVNDEDIQGLMEVMKDLHSTELDLLIHSPGGSIAAAEAIVDYIRSKYKHVRAIVPNYALSAGTMIACGCDEIVMGKHSFLSPIDAQFTFQTKLGVRQIAAGAIKKQFEMAVEDCTNNPEHIGVWYPILEQFGPDLLAKAEAGMDMSPDIVSAWLSKYMLNGDDSLAGAIAGELADHDKHHDHDRRFSRNKVKDMGLRVVDLESSQEWQDAALSVFHCCTHTSLMAKVVKLIENHNGRAFLKMGAMVPMFQMTHAPSEDASLDAPLPAEE